MLGVLKKRSAVYSPVGLDIGLTGTRTVQLYRSDEGWTLEYAAVWPPSASEPGGANSDALGDRLKRALGNQEFVGRSVVLGLSQPDVELNALELPPQQPGTDGSQLASAARWEIQRLSRFDQEAIQTDLWWLPSGKGAHPTAMGVAVPTPIVQGLWETCRGAGARCLCMDVSVCALARAGAAVRPTQPGEVWGLLDVGARGTRLVLCVGDVAVLARTLGKGGQGWTQTLAEALQVSEPSAEQHKQDHGIDSLRQQGNKATRQQGDKARTQPDRARPEHEGTIDSSRPAKLPGPSPQSLDDRGGAQSGSVGRAQSGSVGRAQSGSVLPHSGQLADMVFTALRPDLDRISQEIARSYEYVLQCYPQNQAGGLVLSGAGAAMRGLDNYLTDRLGIDVRVPDRCLDQSGSRLRIGTRAMGRREPLSTYMAAIGLAIEPGAKP
ncbi:MAG: pilus assembly protein PilM [Phycisphaerae bacterium]